IGPCAGRLQVDGNFRPVVEQWSLAAGQNWDRLVAELYITDTARRDSNPQLLVRQRRGWGKKDVVWGSTHTLVYEENDRGVGHPVAVVSSDRDLVVEIVLERRLGDNRLDPEAVDVLALILRPRAADFDLVTGPIVAVAEGFFEHLGVGPVQHHRLLVFEVQD